MFSPAASSSPAHPGAGLYGEGTADNGATVLINGWTPRHGEARGKPLLPCVFDVSDAKLYGRRRYDCQGPRTANHTREQCGISTAASAEWEDEDSSVTPPISPPVWPRDAARIMLPQKFDIINTGSVAAFWAANHPCYGEPGCTVSHGRWRELGKSGITVNVCSWLFATEFNTACSTTRLYGLSRHAAGTAPPEERRLRCFSPPMGYNGGVHPRR
jgi:hypothetical protein